MENLIISGQNVQFEIPLGISIIPGIKVHVPAGSKFNIGKSNFLAKNDDNPNGHSCNLCSLMGRISCDYIECNGVYFERVD